MTKKLIFREAEILDIPQIMAVRYSVKENKLSGNDLVTDEICRVYLTQRGKGWVCETNNTIVGFSIVDLKDYNVWALFVKPEYEGRGIGRTLHDTMLDWYFTKTSHTIWLGTSPYTRAEKFYGLSGWIKTGTHGKGEIKFELSKEQWHQKNRQLKK